VTAQYIVYPLFGRILIGILAKAIWRVKQVKMLSMQEGDENEEVNPC